MTKDNLQEKIEIANSLWETAVSVPEKVNWWGFYAYGDAPGAIGGGFGSFIWFDQRSDMLEFIAQVLPYSPPGRSDLDWGNVAQETAAIVEQMSTQEIDDQAAVSQLNSALASFSQFEWIGTFADLLAGQHQYAKSVREEYWSMQEDSEENSSKPINDEVIGDFKDFLSEWGA
jgi:hypothetical protein